MVKDKARAAKDKGNEAFKAGDYPTAIGHYTEAILADRSDPTYPLNRAAAYLKLGKNEDAERDTTTVLKSSKHNVKALFRRAQARIALRKLMEAQKDLSDVLLIEPSNVATQEEMKKLSQLIQQETAKKSKNPASQLQAASEPVDAPRRVPIQILDPLPTITASSSSVNSSEPVTSISPSASSATKIITDTLEAVSSRSLKSSSIVSSEAITPSNSAHPKPKDITDGAVRGNTRPSPIVGGGIFRASGESTIFAGKKDHILPSTNQAPAELSSPEVSYKIDTSDVIYEAPSNLFDFTRIWESIALKDRWLYFRTIQPTSLPKLCQTSLEPSLLVSILQMFVAVLSSSAGDPEIKQRVLAYMDNFAKVPRFGTVVLFLNKAEKDVAKRVWDLLGIDKPVAVWGLHCINQSVVYLPG